MPDMELFSVIALVIIFLVAGRALLNDPDNLP
jgi:hypothetical protein